MKRLEDWFGRLEELAEPELDQFVALLLAVVSMESSAAPAAKLGGDIRSSHEKPGSKPPTTVTPGCRCGCVSDVDHWGRALEEAKSAGEEILRGAIRVAYRSLRPHPNAGAVAVEDSRDRVKRIIRDYEGWSAQDAAWEEICLRPWSGRPSATEVAWLAHSIRNDRRESERHPETGVRMDSAEDVQARAQMMRNAGHSLRTIGERVGRSHMWVTRNTTAPAHLREAA